MAGKPHNRHIKSQKPKKSRLSFTHVIPSVTVRPFSLSRVVFLHDLWQSAPILGTNGVNNHCFTGWCGGWCHHGSLLPPHVRTVQLLVEDEEKLKKRLRAVLPKCPKPALLIIYIIFIVVTVTNLAVTVLY